MKLKLLIILTLLTCAACGTTTANNNTLSPNAPISQDATKLSPAQLEQLAREITVKVIAGNNQGSGTLIKKENDTYTVVTNNHILKRADTYEVQTADGRIYTAELLPESSLNNYDLALLQFASEVEYQYLPPGGFSPIKVGDSVFAAGYAYDVDIQPGGDGMDFTGGKVSQISEKTFNGGYEIGYTNAIVKGMSGGPLLDGGGELIGINGVLANPLFGNPYRFDDGSVAGEAQLEKLTGSSWGISMARLAELVPELDPAAIPPEYITPPLTGVAARVDEIAEEITVRIEDDDGNGSGVIIARRGNVYYVLTASHVFRNEGNYRIATHDGKVYPVDYEEVKHLSQDLAVATFTVSPGGGENYRVATFGDYRLRNLKPVFVSGWPGWRERKIRKPGRLFTAGLVLSKEGGAVAQTNSFYSLQAGYELVYTNLTHGGMSGGAVLDTQGRLIGIHAAAEAEYLEDGTPIQLGYSLGVPVDRFLAVVNRVGMKREWLQVETSAPKLAQLKIAFKTILVGEAPTNSGSAIDWLKYGNQLWRKVEYDAALAAFDEAIKLQPDLHLAWYAQGLTLSSKQDDRAAVESFEQVTQLKPKFYKAWRERGEALVWLEKNEEALGSFDRAIALNSRDFWLHGMRGYTLDNLKRYQEAIDAYTEAIQLNPDHSWSYNHRGLAKKDQGDLTGAMADFERAIDANPENAGAYTNLGLAKDLLGDKTGAMADFDQAISLDPENAAAYYNRGSAKYKQGNTKGAIADFDKAIALDPEYANAYNSRGVAKRDGGDYQGAIADYDRAIALNLEYADAYYNRGVAKRDGGDLTGAIADYDRVIAMNPEDAKAHYHRGNAKYKQGDIAGAIADFDQAIALNPEDADAYFGRGNAKSKQRDLTGAIADYDRAIAVNPKDALAYHNRGISRHKQGDVKGAIADYGQTIALSPENTLAYIDRSIARYQQGDKQGAIEDMQKAEQLLCSQGSPECQTARELLKQLQQ